MDNSKIELIGAPCGTHGPYTFYKAFKYSKSGRQNILALNEFVFIKLWSDSDIVSIGELQQLWVDKNSDQTLASLRLYILPENTPEGRTDVHGEHEVLALQERVVIRCEDLLTWIADDAAWYRGLPGVWEQSCPGTTNAFRRQSGLADTCLDFKDVDDEKEKLDPSTWEQGPGVVILSFPRYCRYRSVMKRLEGVHNKWLRNSLVTALGGFTVRCRDTRVLFCKDTFDYPDLEGHELLCNHLAPKINLRPRRKRKKQSTSPGESESNESESSLSTISSSAKSNKVQKSRNGLQYDLSQTNRRLPTHTNNKVQSQEEKSFLDRLHRFMNSRQTPIIKIPSIGFKELDLYTFFSKVQRLGGYEGVTNNRMWKSVFDELGGDQSSTSAATCSRRHYERLLLPYERKLRADAMRRRLQTKCRVKAEDDVNDASASRAGSNNIALPGSSDKRDVCERRRKIVLEGMTSSLRSVRLKTDKSCDVAGSSTPRDKENIPLSNAFRAGGSSDLDLDPIDARSTISPEVIVLDAESETPIKTTTTPIVPALKKRKLDMLKEGGLEVTPIAAPSAGGGAGGVMAVAAGVTVTVSTGAASESRNAAPKAASPESPQGQVSIMVTPDLSHMLGMSKESSPSLADSYIAQQRTVINVQDLKQPGFLEMYASRSRNNGQTPPRVIQSRSMYSHSETTVYGNPKECITPGERKQPPRQVTPPIRVPTKASGTEVLDLRMKGSEKPAVEIVRVPTVPGAPPARGVPVRDANRPKPSQILPVSMGRATVGDNLEITLVENPKLALAKLQQEQRNVLLQQRRVAQQQAKSVVPTSRSTATSRENGRHPSTSVAMSSSPGTSSRNRASPANSATSSAGLVIPSPYLGGVTPGGATVGAAGGGATAGGSGKRRNSNDSRSRSRSRVASGPSASGVPSQFLPGAPTSIFPLLQQLPGAASAMSANSTPKNPPFLPLLDTMYYQAICNSQGLYATNVAAAASYMNSLQMSNPQLFAPSAEQLQLYKELMTQHSRVKPNSQGGAEDFARLVQDGSTSITLVGNSKTPTSK